MADRHAAAGPRGGRGAERRAECAAGLYDGDDGDVPAGGQGDLGPVPVRAPVRVRAGGRRHRRDRGARRAGGVRRRRAGPVRGTGRTGSAVARAAAAADGAAVMRSKLGPTATVSCWVLLPLAVLGHAALAVLAVAEFATMGWPLPTWFDTGAVTLVQATTAAGLAATTLVAVRAAASTWALQALMRAARHPVPPLILSEAATLGCAARLDVVAGEEAFAVTHGLFRPRILVSTGLTTALTPAEIGAVLAHEREHLRRRHPLRMLAARLAAAWACYLPAGRWLASRAALRYELTADRAAAGRAGRSVLAGALLKLASMPACPAAAAASPAGDGPQSLEARVAQLESGRPPRRRPAVSRMLASAGTLSLLVPASMCCLAMSQFLPGGVL